MTSFPMASNLPLFDETDLSDALAQDMLRRGLPADAGHYDEFRTEAGTLRPVWQGFANHLGAPLDDLTRRQAWLARQIQEDGITYNVYSAPGGQSRPWSLEALPLILSAQEWRGLERGVAQRARLLNQILQDTYGEQRLLKQALLPSALVLGHPGYVRGLHGVQPVGGVYLHVLALDLARGHDGNWWVVTQRTQAPSGLGYVMQNRLLVSRLFPEAYRALHVQHLASGYRQLVDTLTDLAQECAGGQPPRLALLTPGPYNETYFEHAYLARYLGLPLVEGGDLVVREDSLFLKTVQGLEPIHGLLRRLDDDYCDPLELRADSTLGVPGLMQAVRARKVVLANALGTGFLQSPALHGFLPALSDHLLGEPLALPSLPTWWCGEASAWQDIQPRLHQQVIRHSYPGGGEVVLGNQLSAEALNAWRACIELDPAAYTVQSFVPYAQAPVWSAGQVNMRSAALRVYALSDGKGGWQVLPGGMTRIANRETGPMSMQHGGSSLDTWVLTDGPVDTFSMMPTSVRGDELVQRQRPVSSRTGENLFWMGRYTERCEQQLRLLQTLKDLPSGEDKPHDSVLQAIAELCEQHGLVPAGTPHLLQAPRVFERALLDALSDARAKQGAYSLAYNLSALDRSAQVLRDRLSAEHARWLRAMGSEFVEVLGRSAEEAPAGVASLDQIQPALDRLGLQLAAITGAQTDRMTRDPGWRLLTVGRLIERLVNHATVLQAFWSHRALAHPDGFDRVLELFDSTITFRARFQRRLEVPAVLALLVMDESNPRALACILRRLRTELGKLPIKAGESGDWLTLLPAEGVGLPLSLLADPASGAAAMQQLLESLVTLGWRLSDEVGRRYFVHAEPTDSMVST
ncbi:circularly permuted type 2 ATP-grasp protein [Aquabacterium sp.]|uniref:circularly permuted type 2 ATP-grasp protein n=1 Tax=Aquabacterium sp. TaxID=1872578 RepID=UPI002E340C7B|nr:circularly permuted type 2 ATP-grasp protein [Aquabacterium sp.]HEX5312719.1 circularly permuted type 2 ATP-grasp protein [Aquabacterium sp.]